MPDGFYNNLDPSAQGALLGALLGAGGGGLTGYLSGKHKLRNTLTGALLGGAAGTGLGALAGSQSASGAVSPPSGADAPAAAPAADSSTAPAPPPADLPGKPVAATGPGSTLHELARDPPKTMAPGTAGVAGGALGLAVAKSRYDPNDIKYFLRGLDKPFVSAGQAERLGQLQRLPDAGALAQVQAEQGLQDFYQQALRQQQWPVPGNVAHEIDLRRLLARNEATSALNLAAPELGTAGERLLIPGRVIKDIQAAGRPGLLGHAGRGLAYTAIPALIAEALSTARRYQEGHR